MTSEERDSAQREREMLTATISKHETTTLDVIRKLQHEAARVGLDSDPKYHTLDNEGKKVTYASNN